MLSYRSFFIFTTFLFLNCCLYFIYICLSYMLLLFLLHFCFSFLESTSQSESALFPYIKLGNAKKRSSKKMALHLLSDRRLSDCLFSDLSYPDHNYTSSDQGLKAILIVARTFSVELIFIPWSGKLLSL